MSAMSLCLLRSRTLCRRRPHLVDLSTKCSHTVVDVSTITTMDGVDETTPWLNEDEAAAWRTVVMLQNQLRAVLARGIQRDGLSEADYAILVNLSEAPDHR